MRTGSCRFRYNPNMSSERRTQRTWSSLLLFAILLSPTESRLDESGSTCETAVPIRAADGRFDAPLPTTGTAVLPGRSKMWGSRGLWLRLDGDQAGEWELTTCGGGSGVDGVDADLAIFHSCDDAEVTETRLRCQGGEWRRQYDKPTSPLYMLVRSAPGDRAMLRARQVKECEEPGLAL